MSKAISYFQAQMDTIAESFPIDEPTFRSQEKDVMALIHEKFPTLSQEDKQKINESLESYQKTNELKGKEKLEPFMEEAFKNIQEKVENNLLKSFSEYKEEVSFFLKDILKTAPYVVKRDTLIQKFILEKAKSNINTLKDFFISSYSSKVNEDKSKVKKLFSELMEGQKQCEEILSKIEEATKEISKKEKEKAEKIKGGVKESENLILSNARGAYAQPLAEYSIMGMLHFSYSVPKYIKSYNENKWERQMNEMISEKRLLITDVDGNRFEIKDVFSLSVKEKRKLDYQILQKN